jgi:hypothetical protein
VSDMPSFGVTTPETAVKVIDRRNERRDRNERERFVSRAQRDPYSVSSREEEEARMLDGQTSKTRFLRGSIRRELSLDRNHPVGTQPPVNVQPAFVAHSTPKPTYGRKPR